MRRRRRLRAADLPRLVIGGAVAFAGLFGGRYGRIEGAHVLATDAEGRILVVRTTYLGPGWMLPGGRVERGETPHAAAVRETLEETGLHVRVERLVLVDAHRASDVSFVFRGHVEGGELEPAVRRDRRGGMGRSRRDRPYLSAASSAPGADRPGRWRSGVPRNQTPLTRRGSEGRPRLESVDEPPARAPGTAACRAATPADDPRRVPDEERVGSGPLRRQGGLAARPGARRTSARAARRTRGSSGW